MVHHDVFVRWNRQPDVNLEPGAVPVLVTGCDHRHAAAGDALVVRFQPLDLLQYDAARGIRRFRAFESDLWSNLHGDLLDWSPVPIHRPANGCMNPGQWLAARPRNGRLNRSECNTFITPGIKLRLCYLTLRHAT